MTPDARLGLREVLEKSAAVAARAVSPGLGGRRALLGVERDLMVYRRSWLVIVSGLFEPFFYLLSIGFGVGHLVGQVADPHGSAFSYATFVAPALLAASSMNGAIYDSTMNVFYKIKHAKTYEAVLATPVGVGDVALGEVTWALLRGTLYAAFFLATMLVMGLVASPWAALALPGAVLIGFAFAAVGLAITSFVRAWQDFEWVQLVLLPMFLFSATFFPLSTYPPPLQAVVQLMPLYHGVDLLRRLTTGAVGPTLLVHVAYLLAMGLAGLAVATRRLDKLLLP